MFLLVLKVHLIDQCTHAMGLKNEDIEKPFVGVATTWNEAAPCNITLSRQAQSVQKRVLN